jgi:hypothetical protein
MNSSRRVFLAGGVTQLMLILPAGWAVLGATPGCGGNECGEPGVTRSGDNLVFTSSCDSDHTHTFTLAVAQIDMPPPNGLSGETSSDEGHTHAVALTTADLTQIQGGGTVTRVTSSASGHTHSFAFKKA